jgi:cytochrome b
MIRNDAPQKASPHQDRIMSDKVATSPAIATVKVWDIFIRIFHWALVIAFAIAFFTEGEPYWLHTSAGFVVAGLVAARIVWGFVGPEYARFRNFAYGPKAVFGYLLDLVRFRAKRYIGHSPAGGAMVLALIIMLSATTASGIVMYFTGDEARDGRSAASLTVGDEGEEADGERDGGSQEESLLQEVHSAFGHIAFFLALFHIGGVALASFAHRENLPRSMVNGTKRA